VKQNISISCPFYIQKLVKAIIYVLGKRTCCCIMFIEFKVLNVYFSVMNPTLIEESSSKRIPHNLEILVKSLEGLQESNSSTNRNDLIAVLLYVLMMETGYSPLQAGDASVCGTDHGFSIHKLNCFCTMPANWKNIQQNHYEMSFILGRFTQYPCRLLIIPIDDALIINLLITNMIQGRNNYTLGIQPSEYIVNPTSSCIPTKFRNLKDLSLKFKNSLSHPARSVILTKEGILNASLLGIPDEIKIKIFKYLEVSDLLKVSLVCRHLYYITEDQGLWRYFLVRDFLSEDVVDLLSQPGVSCIITWKEEYKRKHRNQNARKPRWHLGGILYNFIA